MDLIKTIRDKASRECQRIVLPEGDEERTILAADQIIREKLAHVILLGNPQEIEVLVEKYGLNNIRNAQIIDPKNHPKKKEYADLLYEIRKLKGLTQEKAMELVEDPLYLGVLMIKAGDADGEVAGAKNSTGDVF